MYYSTKNEIKNGFFYMFETLLEKLTLLAEDPDTVCELKNKNTAGECPHIHAEWELKFFNNRTEIIPPRIIHISSNAPDFQGAFLVSSNELQINDKDNKFPVIFSLDENSPAFSKLLEAFSALPSTENICRTELLKTFFKLLKNEISCRSRSNIQTDIVKNVADYLERHYFNCNLSISEIAEYTGYSQQYLNKKFKSVFGYSIQQELIKIRLHYAKQMLLAGNYLVADVAKLTGWRNAFYFSYVYRKHYGYPPSATIMTDGETI